MNNYDRNLDPKKVIEIDINDFKIYTSLIFDGYGLLHLEDIVKSFYYLLDYKSCTNGMEWCSGPGYIGFSMLSTNIIKNCVFSDIHKPLSKVVNKSISVNSLEDRTKFICSNNFNDIPKKKFDVIFGNPPHFHFPKGWKPDNKEEYVTYQEKRKFQDQDWKIHQDFFNNVSEYLENDGSILLMENVKGSSPETFKDMIEKNNLKITKAFKSSKWPDDIWYMKINHA